MYDNLDINIDGKVSKIDKWKYNDILNDLARHALINKGNIYFNGWVKKFVTALKPVSTPNLPMKTKLEKVEQQLGERLYWSKRRNLQKNRAIWYHPYKSEGYLNKWEQDFWEAYFDYALEMATQAGFTIHLDSIDQGIAMRG